MSLPLSTLPIVNWFEEHKMARWLETKCSQYESSEAQINVQNFDIVETFVSTSRKSTPLSRTQSACRSQHVLLIEKPVKINQWLTEQEQMDLTNVFSKYVVLFSDCGLIAWKCKQKLTLFRVYDTGMETSGLFKVEN